MPEVFSRVRRGASFRRPQAETCSAFRAGHFLKTGNRAYKASGTQGKYHHSAYIKPEVLTLVFRRNSVVDDC